MDGLFIYFVGWDVSWVLVIFFFNEKLMNRFEIDDLLDFNLF